MPRNKPLPNLDKQASVATNDKLQPHQILLSSTIQNAVGMAAFSLFSGNSRESMNLTALIEGLYEKNSLVVAEGDLKPVETMLYDQAQLLQTIAVALLNRAAFEKSHRQFHTQLALGLKAQAQSRATIEALANIKNPRPVSYVQQQNIAQGHQQVNNTFTVMTDPTDHSTITDHAAPVKNSALCQNELLEASYEKRLDIRASSSPVRDDSNVETLGQIDRRKDPRRKGAIIP